MFLGDSKNFGKQVEYADKRNAPAVIIEGSHEREQGIVQIKDLVAGKQAAAAITDNAEWKAARPGQFEVRAQIWWPRSEICWRAMIASPSTCTMPPLGEGRGHPGCGLDSMSETSPTNPLRRRRPARVAGDAP